MKRWTTLFLIGAAGCSADGRAGDSWGGTIDTLPNGAVHTVSPAEGIWDEGGAWTLREDLRIGAREGEDYEIFSNVVSILTDEQGRIFVLDGGFLGAAAQEIRVFDADGAFVRTIGSRGNGPEEFATAMAMAWGGDGSLLVVDVLNGRYSRFDTSGVFLGTAPRSTLYSREPWGSGVGTDGRFLDIHGSYDDAGMRIGILVPVDPETGVASDTFPVPRTDIVEHRFRFDYSPSHLWGALPDNSVWSGTNDVYRIARTSASGDTLMIVEREFDPPLLTAAQDSMRMASLAEYLELPSFSSMTDMDRILTDRVPAFGDVFLDSGGNLWVAPYGGRTELVRIFDVFDPQGRYLGLVRSETPLATQFVTADQSHPVPVITDEYIYGITRDELDVPYVVRLRIEK